MFGVSVSDIMLILRPPTQPFEAILLYDQNQLKRHVIEHTCAYARWALRCHLFSEPVDISILKVII